MRSKPLFVVAFATMLSLAGCIGADLAEESTGGGLSWYMFDASDASDTMSNSTDDTMFHVTMTAGDDPIDFVNLSVRISADGGPSYSCVEQGTGWGDESCVYSVDNSQGEINTAWELAETITVMENGDNICSGGCEIDLTLIDMEYGTTLNSQYIYIE